MNFLELQDIRRKSLIGFEFEFFSFLSIDDAAKSLSKVLGKRIFVSSRYHSKMKPTEKTWKIEKDYSGGSNMFELITPPLAYNESIIFLIKILNWLSKWGWTNEYSAFHYNISFDNNLIKTRRTIDHLDKLKFCLGFNEDMIYQWFPTRENSIYAISIKNIFPKDSWFSTSVLDKIFPENWEVPNKKYYGVNFTKSKENYLEFRYIGGQDYEKKFAQINEIINYSVDYLYNHLVWDGSYNSSDMQELSNIANKWKSVIEGCSNYDIFKYRFPDIHISVDMINHDENIKTYWNTLRKELSNLIIYTGLKDGYINWDSDMSKVQLKGCTLSGYNITDNIELIECTLTGYYENCELWNCKAINCHFLECNLLGFNNFTNCKIVKTTFNQYTECTNCYIDNFNYAIEGKIIKSIIRSGVISPELDIYSTDVTHKPQFNMKK